jgi:hypothetical protein
MMSVFEQQEYHNAQAACLIQGEKARIKNTGQIVTLKRVSDHGVSVVSFSGSDYFISDIFLEPVIDFQ